MEQVYVPAGDFLMGTNDVEAKRTEAGGRAYPEVPQFTLYLDSYWIDKYEVTNSQYALCLAAGVCTEPHRIASFSYPDYFTSPKYANYPVVWLSWFQARDYCTWAGRRLPTEAEWEKAARGTDGRKYPWGNEELTGERANFCDVNCTRTIANPIGMMVTLTPPRSVATLPASAPTERWICLVMFGNGPARSLLHILMMPRMVGRIPILWANVSGVPAHSVMGSGGCVRPYGIAHWIIIHGMCSESAALPPGIIQIIFVNKYICFKMDPIVLRIMVLKLETIIETEFSGYHIKFRDRAHAYTFYFS